MNQPFQIGQEVYWTQSAYLFDVVGVRFCPIINEWEVEIMFSNQKYKTSTWQPATAIIPYKIPRYELRRELRIVG